MLLSFYSVIQQSTPPSFTSTQRRMQSCIAWCTVILYANSLSRTTLSSISITDRLIDLCRHVIARMICRVTPCHCYSAFPSYMPTYTNTCDKAIGLSILISCSPLCTIAVHHHLLQYLFFTHKLILEATQLWSKPGFL